MLKNLIVFRSIEEFCTECQEFLKVLRNSEDMKSVI